MRLLQILTVSFSLISFSATTFAGAVLDIVNPEVSINQKSQRGYIPITNIGNESGTFIVQVKNITDPQHVITYSNKELKSLPVIISPLLIPNLGAGNNKRVSVLKKGKIETPMKLQIVISEYKKPVDNNGDIADDAAGIDIQGSIHYIANIDVA